jgi:hypothetical protein
MGGPTRLGFGSSGLFRTGQGPPSERRLARSAGQADQTEMMSWVSAWAIACCSVGTPNFCFAFSM